MAEAKEVKKYILKIGMIDRSKFLVAPQSPGVYIFLADGRPIYIGKSKNIRERIRAYLELKDTRESVPKIIEEADDIKWIITPTEEDAIFLEQKLIAENLPKYNIKLKDPRGLKYIKINMLHEFPSISLTRTTSVRDSSLHFGPFNVRDARELFEGIRRIFNIRTCTEQKFKTFRRAKRPCLDGQIFLCVAPCAGNENRADYMRRLTYVSEFLRGRFSEVLNELERRMWEEAEKENFELAAKYRDRIEVLKKILERKRPIFPDYRDADYASAEIAGDRISVSMVKVREGRFFGSYGGIFIYGGQDVKELISSFFTRSSDVHECVSDYFAETERIGRFVFRPPQLPEENELISFAKRSSFEQLLQSEEKIGRLMRMMEELSKFLMIQEVPKRVEIYDFSNFGGKKLVGVKVHFEFGELMPSRLRIYNVTEVSHDDLLALRNVLERRLKDGLISKDVPMPDLIFIDGGKAHYSVAKSVIESFGLKIPFACIKKEKRKERDITILYEGLELRPKGKLLEFILHLRDSAHKRAKRFSVEQSTKVR